MKALILAAGYATRLYPLTKNYPKALLKVGRRPIIDYIIDKLDVVGDINEIIVVTNSKFVVQFRRWSSALRTQKHLSLLDDSTKDEKKRYGAIGDMNFAINRKRLKEDLLVIGADNLFSAGLNDFLAYGRAHRTHLLIGAYSIRNKSEAKKYGVIKLDKFGRVVDFQEKPSRPKSKLVAMCLYYFPKEKLGLVKKYLATQRGACDALGFYIDWLRRKEVVHGFVFHGSWYDIGDRKFYNEAKKKFASQI